MKPTILLLAMLTMSCATMRQKRIDRICQTCPEKQRTDSSYSKTETEVIRYDTVMTPADSSYYFAWMKCKDGSVPVIVKEVYKNGSRTRQTGAIDKDGKMSVKCDTDSLTKVIEIKDKYITELINKTTERTIVIELKWWQRVLMVLGGLFVIYLLGRFVMARFDKWQNGI